MAILMTKTIFEVDDVGDDDDSDDVGDCSDNDYMLSLMMLSMTMVMKQSIGDFSDDVDDDEDDDMMTMIW